MRKPRLRDVTLPKSEPHFNARVCLAPTRLIGIPSTWVLSDSRVGEFALRKVPPLSCLPLAWQPHQQASYSLSTSSTHLADNPTPFSSEVFLVLAPTLGSPGSLTGQLSAVPSWPNIGPVPVAAALKGTSSLICSPNPSLPRWPTLTSRSRNKNDSSDYLTFDLVKDFLDSDTDAWFRSYTFLQPISRSPVLCINW